MLLLRQRDWAKRAMRALSKGGPLRNVRTLVTRDEPLQLSENPIFSPIALPEGPELADVVWTLTVKIRDVFWAATVVELQVTIGQCHHDCSYLCLCFAMRGLRHMVPTLMLTQYILSLMLQTTSTTTVTMRGSLSSAGIAIE